MKIILHPHAEQSKNFVAWHFDSKGLFSVKSAYKVHVDMMKRSCISQEGQMSEGVTVKNEVFKKIWQVQCPPKVHHFLWRLAHNSHPLHMNIARRGVDLDTRCAVCHKYFEDGGHLFLTCKFAKQRWRILMLEDVRLKLLPCRSAIEVLEEILELPADEKLLSIAFLWNWWSERNRGNHGEQHMTADQFHFSIRRHVDEWKHYFQKKQSEVSLTECRWERPPPEVVKINIDAAFHQSTRSGGWGAICRDNMSDICFAVAGPLVMMSDAMHAEAMSLSNAIHIAEELGVGRAVFETDCINLQQAMMTASYDYGPLGVLISNLKFRLRLNFLEATVIYAPRSCNRPAHELASLGVEVVDGEHVLWTSNYPNSVARLVSGDIAVS
jgi:hypothetical protein